MIVFSECTGHADFYVWLELLSIVVYVLCIVLCIVLFIIVLSVFFHFSCGFGYCSNLKVFENFTNLGIDSGYKR